jgi:hypothetical protein
MLELVIGLAIVGGAVLGPIAWIAWRDGLRERALTLRGEIQTVVDRRLGGESLLAVDVTARTPWRTGRVILKAPSDWQWLFDEVLMRVLERLPAGYELVVKPGIRQAPVGAASTTMLQAV